MAIQVSHLKKILPFMFLTCLFVPSFAMDPESTQQIPVNQAKTLIPFQESPKYLVHIGFPNGLPENGIMRPGKCDAANYFSLNGPLPSNDYMPHLDQAPFTVILELTETIMKRIVGFHVTEVLLAGKIDLTREACTIVAPQGAHIPQSLKGRIVFYEGKGLENRTKKTMEKLGTLGAYPVYLAQERDDSGKLSWSNRTIANATVNETSVNVNLDGAPDYFNNILKSLNNVSYTCPGNAGASGIGHLSMLKGAIHNGDQAGVVSHQAQLIGWVGSLAHLEDIARQDFVSRVKALPEANKDNECIIF